MGRKTDKVFAVREWRKIAYRYNHREQHREFCRRWYLSKRGKEKRKEWNKLHPEYIKERKAKRRGLGFIPLNQFFKGSICHHIDKIHIVYIPKELHISIPHNVWTDQGMKEINAKTFEWLSMEKLTQHLNKSIE